MLNSNSSDGTPHQQHHHSLWRRQTQQDTTTVTPFSYPGTNVSILINSTNKYYTKLHFVRTRIQRLLGVEQNRYMVFQSFKHSIYIQISSFGATVFCYYADRYISHQHIERTRFSSVQNGCNYLGL